MNLSVQILATSAVIALYVAEKNDVEDPYYVQFMFATACVYSMLYLAAILRWNGML